MTRKTAKIHRKKQQGGDGDGGWLGWMSSFKPTMIFGSKPEDSKTDTISQPAAETVTPPVEQPVTEAKPDSVNTTVDESEKPNGTGGKRRRKTTKKSKHQKSKK